MRKKKSSTGPNMNPYNTQRSPLAIREYGRNTQRLIAYAKTIEPREVRQAFVERIIDLVMEMHPHSRNIDDYRLKTWAHVLQMADYELDVDFPDNVPPPKKGKRPEIIPYPQKNRRFRHYGRNVRELIRKAEHMEPSPIQQEFVSVIGSYMKMAYKTWNRENVSDEIIRLEFEELTNSDLQINERANLDGLINPKKRPRNISSSSNGRNNHKKHSRKRK